MAVGRDMIEARMQKKISGRGGGGGKGGGGNSARIPVEDADSLQSKAFANVLDLICEGEIEGLAAGEDNPLQSVYLDGTPIENPSGSRNFTGIEFQSRNGTQDQDYIPKYSTVESEVPVGVRVTYDTPVVRSITNELVDAIRVRISIPQLTEQNVSTGDLRGSELTYKIELQSNGGGYSEILRDTIIGKGTSKYERAYRIDLEGEGPWDVRVSRVTEDSDSVAVQNSTWWESYTEIIDAKLRFPNSALCALRVDASQFSSVPTRGYDVKMLKIQIPSNASVRSDGSLTYSGEWDGTFITAWSSNPAWCFYDLLTNTRYGLGRFIDSDLVDKWALYTIGQYCDELVDDGFGETEPRFSCNIYLQSRAEAFKVLSHMASIFRSMIYWAEGAITLVQDSPAEVSHLFTPANVVDGLFNYSGSSAKARHTVALVSWSDPDDLYRQRVEYVEDQDAIARLGVIETQVVAFGCTSQGQAHRLGRWLLYTERFQTETVQFKTGMGAAICRPGQVIEIADPVRAGVRRGGRVSSATVNAIVCDGDPITDVNPANASLKVLLPDGTVEERSVLSIAGNTITVATEITGTPFSAEAQAGSIWILQDTNVEAQKFKVITVLESEDGAFEVTALAHNEDKFESVENNLQIEPPDISNLSSIPATPEGLQLTETLYEVSGDVRVKVTVSWNKVAGAIGYVLQYQVAGKNVVQIPEFASNEWEILNAEPGVYTATVYAVNALGKRSGSATATKTIVGRAAAPGNVQGFSLIPVAGMAYLSWDKATDLDVLLGGSVRIRYTPNIVDPVWKSGVDITPALAGTATRANVPHLTGTYMAKFVDSSGVASDEEAIIQTTTPEALALNVVETVTESPDFLGDKTNCFVTSEFGGGLVIDGLPIDDWGDIDDVILWDFNGGVLDEAEYLFANAVDLGDKFTCRLTAAIEVAAFDVSETIDERLDDIDDWVDLDGDFIDTVNAELYLRTSDDNVTWSDWKRFFVGEYAFRYIEFKMKMTSTNRAHNIVVSNLAVTIDVPDRTVDMQGLTSGAGTYVVTYDEPFIDKPAVGITAYNMATGDYFEIASDTRSGFEITFKNAAGAAVSRNFDVLAKGYGRQLA